MSTPTNSTGLPRPDQHSGSTIPMGTPGELASATPYIMGFTPEKSILIVTMKKNGDAYEHGLVMRMDIPENINELHAGLESFRNALANTDGSAGHALIIVVDDITPDGVSDMPYRDYIDVINNTLANEDMQPIASIYTDGESVGMYDSPTFTPISARERDYVAAHYVYAGIAPLENRDAYASLISYTPNAEVEATIAEHIDRYARDQLPREHVIPIADGIVNTLTSEGALANDDISQIAGALHNIHVRDVVLFDVSEMDAHTLEHATGNLRAIVANTPNEHVAPVATTLAINEWLRGNGANTNMALDRALASNQDYSLRGLIDAAVSNGIAPDFWRESIVHLSREECAGLHAAPPSAGKTQQHEPLARVSTPAAPNDIAL